MQGFRLAFHGNMTSYLYYINSTVEISNLKNHEATSSRVLQGHQDTVTISGRQQMHKKHKKSHVTQLKYVEICMIIKIIISLKNR